MLGLATGREKLKGVECAQSLHSLFVAVSESINVKVSICQTRAELAFPGGVSEADAQGHAARVQPQLLHGAWLGACAGVL
eukprot:4711530-Pleurochrysis_carterae.AAC.3